MLRILRQTLRLVWRNRLAALQVSVGPLVLFGLLNRAAGVLLGHGYFDAGSALLLGGIGAALLSWVAVAWHRHVLLDEPPGGLLPPLAGPYVLHHLGWSGLLGLSALLLGVAAEEPLARILAPLAGIVGLPLADMGPSLLILLATAYLGLRFGLVLPAAALGRLSGLAESWEVTRPLGVSLIGLAVLGMIGLWLLQSTVQVALGLLLLGAEDLLFDRPDPLLLGVAFISLVSNWLGLMLGLSLLTTLYGHVVERRPLP